MSESREAWWRDDAFTAASSRSRVDPRVVASMARVPWRRTLPTMLYMSASCAEALHAMLEGPPVEAPTRP